MTPSLARTFITAFPKKSVVQILAPSKASPIGLDPTGKVSIEKESGACPAAGKPDKAVDASDRVTTAKSVTIPRTKALPFEFMREVLGIGENNRGTGEPAHNL